MSNITLQSLDWGDLLNKSSNDQYDSDETICEEEEFKTTDKVIINNTKNENHLAESKIEETLQNIPFNTNLIPNEGDSLNNDYYDNSNMVEMKRTESCENNYHKNGDSKNLVENKCVEQTKKQIKNGILDCELSLERIGQESETLHHQVIKEYLPPSNKRIKNNTFQKTLIPPTSETTNETLKSDSEKLLWSDDCSIQTDNSFLQKTTESLENIIGSDFLNEILGRKEDVRRSTCSPPLTLIENTHPKIVRSTKVLPNYKQKLEEGVALKLLPARKCSSKYKDPGRFSVGSENHSDEFAYVEDTFAKMTEKNYCLKGKHKVKKNNGTGEVNLVISRTGKFQSKKRGCRLSRRKKTSENTNLSKVPLSKSLLEIEQTLNHIENKTLKWMSGIERNALTREQAFHMLLETQNIDKILESLKVGKRSQHDTREKKNKLSKRSRQLVITIDKAIAEADQLMKKEYYEKMTKLAENNSTNSQDSSLSTNCDQDSCSQNNGGIMKEKDIYENISEKSEEITNNAEFTLKRTIVENSTADLSSQYSGENIYQDRIIAKSDKQQRIMNKSNHYLQHTSSDIATENSFTQWSDANVKQDKFCKNITKHQAITTNRKSILRTTSSEYSSKKGGSVGKHISFSSKVDYLYPSGIILKSLLSSEQSSPKAKHHTSNDKTIDNNEMKTPTAKRRRVVQKKNPSNKNVDENTFEQKTFNKDEMKENMLVTALRNNPISQRNIIPKSIPGGNNVEKVTTETPRIIIGMEQIGCTNVHGSNDFRSTKEFSESLLINIGHREVVSRSTVLEKSKTAVKETTLQKESPLSEKAVIQQYPDGSEEQNRVDCYNDENAHCSKKEWHFKNNTVYNDQNALPQAQVNISENKELFKKTNNCSVSKEIENAFDSVFSENSVQENFNFSETSLQSEQPSFNDISIMSVKAIRVKHPLEYTSSAADNSDWLLNWYL